jgi:hypothetical protein
MPPPSSACLRRRRLRRAMFLGVLRFGDVGEGLDDEGLAPGEAAVLEAVEVAPGRAGAGAAAAPVGVPLLVVVWFVHVHNLLPSPPGPVSRTRRRIVTPGGGGARGAPSAPLRVSVAESGGISKGEVALGGAYGLVPSTECRVVDTRRDKFSRWVSGPKRG